MKKIINTVLLVCASLLTLSSCSVDSNSEYPKLINIDFIVTATKQTTTSRIETSIITPSNENGVSSLDIKSSSYSNSHVPFEKKIIQQSIPSFAVLGLRYQDDLFLNVDDAFEPYSVNLEIKIDDKIVADKTVIIDTEGKVVNLKYDFE